MYIQYVPQYYYNISAQWANIIHSTLHNVVGLHHQSPFVGVMKTVL